MHVPGTKKSTDWRRAWAWSVLGLVLLLLVGSVFHVAFEKTTDPTGATAPNGRDADLKWASLRSRIAEFAPTDDSDIQEMAREIMEYSTELDETGFQEAAGQLLIDWGDACRGRFGRSQLAIEAYARAERIADELGDEGTAASIALVQGRIHNERGEFDAAMAKFGRAVEGARFLPQIVRGSGFAFARLARAAWEELPRETARAAFAAAKTSPGARVRREHQEICFRALELVREVGSDAASMRRPAAWMSSAPSGETRELWGQIEAARRDLEGRWRRATAAGNLALLEKLAAASRALNAKVSGLVAGLERTQPLWADALFPKAADPQTIRESLAAETAIIELAISKDSGWGFVVTDDGLAMVGIENPMAIRQDLMALRGQVASGSKYLDVERLWRVSRAILSPVFHELGRQGKVPPVHWVVSLKGELARMPMEIMLTERPGPDSPVREFPFLVKRFDVSYVPSATTYAAMRGRRSLKSAGPRHCEYFGIGMPFDARAEAAVEGRRGADLDGFVSVLPAKAEAAHRTVLFGAADEVLTIASLFASEGERSEVSSVSRRIHDEPLSETSGMSGVSGRRFRTLIRGGAREDRIKRDVDLKSARFVHFACHGEADISSPARSRLILAQSDVLRETTGEDGFLFFSELAGLGLNAELLVLSACETSDGVVVPQECPMGMAQAGLLAGAERVLSTLWAVDDDGARRLMTDFFRRVIAKEGKTVSCVHALAESKRAAIAQGVPVPTWSAYILWDAAGT